MKLKRRIFAGLIMCMIVVVFLGAYIHFFQPEVQISMEHNINSILRTNLEKKHISNQNINPRFRSPISNVATLMGLKINAKLQNLNFTKYQKNFPYRNILNYLSSDLKTKIKLKQSPWKIASNWVNAREIHPNHGRELGSILNQMAKGKIISADIGRKGTQLKIMLVLEGQQKVVFKPKRFSRDHIIQGQPYAGADRHNGEIAAFHLNRILGFNRTPLTVGRKINLLSEIRPVASSALLKTFIKQENNSCFYGHCYYCKPSDPACGDGDIIEGAVILWLPERFTLKKHRHPWQRTYRDNISARWEIDHGYCERVRSNPLYETGPRLLDLIDAAIFDYLIGNADRHHYEVFADISDSMVLLLDNGKSFGNPYWDELTILAPLYQCCRIRSNTYSRLQVFINHLEEAMKEILSYDPVSPVLTKHHLEAFDRRLKTIMAAIEVCCDEKGQSNVVVNV